MSLPFAICLAVLFGLAAIGAPVGLAIIVGKVFRVEKQKG